jgi:hypothetical protein
VEETGLMPDGFPVREVGKEGSACLTSASMGRSELIS